MAGAKLTNTPKVRLGLVGVSRDCFPVELTRRRTAALARALREVGVRPVRCSVVVEREDDVLAALAELGEKEVNALVIYLGNFGPEGPTAILADDFSGPVMVCAAAEESAAGLVGDRGDALCGLLSLRYNLELRRAAAHVPERPVGLPAELAPQIADFAAVARVLIGLINLKVFAFGPRPQDFYACHAPLQPLYDLGVEVMESSELDLLQRYREAAGRRPKINAIVRQMKRELGGGGRYPDLLPRLAQLEVALLDFYDEQLGASAFGVFANKCWPAFEPEFGFVPCYVNSRLAARGIPVACEVDLCGAISEYLVQLASGAPATLLDLNNTVPADLLPEKTDLHGATRDDLFMAFHCGNTCATCLADPELKHQVIMHRLMEPDRAPDITRGTLEGRLRPGPTTLFRLQATPAGELASYLAEGRILDRDPQSFGAIGVVAVPGFQRFYRHVLLENGFPHHGAFGFTHVGRILFAALRYLGLQDIGVPLPAGERYPGECPF